MALNLQESFERSCRLCAEEQEVTIMIFSLEAEAMLLQNKLNKYLLIEIDENDKLPKNICVKCCSKLQTVCDFIDTARKSQEVLLNRSILLDQVSTDVPTPLKNDIKSEPMVYFDEESHVTEMEVSVDPMLILQNSEGPTSPRNEDNEIENLSDDVTHLHGLVGENVTLKLIRRGDQSTEEEFDESKKQKPFPCYLCDRAFITELALKNHGWSHSNEDKVQLKEFKCHSCKQEYDSRSDLLAHLKDHRNSSTCKICSRVNEDNLAIHMKTHQSPNGQHVCKVCGRSYNTRSNLKTHSITHSNDRPFNCHLCKKSFKRNQDLKFHINQHTGAKPYKCPFCEKCFASSGNCYSHRSRMHPGRRVEGKAGHKRRVVPRDKPQPAHALPAKMPLVSVKGVYKYQCQQCDHSFMKRDNFTYHMYQHTGEKPFHCSFCPEKYVTRRGLLIHHEKDHPTNERPLAYISNNALLK